jgi:hypothetical protein
MNIWRVRRRGPPRRGPAVVERVLQSVVKVQRRTEGGDAPGWQGATSEKTGSL